MANEKKAATLAAKLSRVMASVKHVEKRGDNKQQGYRYLQESDLKAALQPHLSSEGVACLVAVSYVDVSPFGRTKSGAEVWLTKAQITLSFIDGESGERLDVQGFGTGVDTQDKGLAKAVTMAVKGILSHSFLIPTGDDPERDERDHESNANSKREAAQRNGQAGVKGDAVDTIFSVVTLTEKEGKKGPWYLLEVANDDGEAYEVRVFGRAVPLAKQAREGHKCRIVGKWDEFNGHAYISADKLQAVAPATVPQVEDSDIPF